MSSQEAGAPWVPITQLSEAVGPSERQLAEYKKQGILKPGHHFYTVGPKRGRFYYSVPRVRETLLELAAKQARRRRPETYDAAHASQLSATRAG